MRPPGERSIEENGAEDVKNRSLHCRSSYTQCRHQVEVFSGLGLVVSQWFS